MKARYSTMLNFVFLICTLLMFPAFPASYGQAPENLDSLEALIITLQGVPESIPILSRLTEGYLVDRPDKALLYSDQLLGISYRTGNLPGVIDAMTFKARIYRTLYKYDSSLMFNDRAIILADSIGDEKRLANLYSHKGHTLFNARGPKDGIIYYAESYRLYKDLDDSLGMADALNGLGVMYLRLSVYDSAVYSLLEMVKLSEKLGSEEALGKGYINLGNSYYELGEPEKAASYLNKSLAINDKYNKKKYVAVACNILGNIAYDYGDMDEALRMYERCLELNRGINNLSGMADAMVNIGNIHEVKGELAEALEFYTEAKDTFESIADWEGYLIAYKNCGLIHERKGRYGEALAIYDSCLTIAESMSNLYTMRELYSNIYKTYEIMRDYRQAFHYYKIHDQYKDSIFNLEKTKSIADLELKYQKEKDQARILKLENENLEKDLVVEKRTSQRNIYFFTGIGCILLILFFLVYYRQKAVKDRIVAENRIRQLEEEKRMLSARALVEGQEDERKRIAVELHDGIGVLLSAVKMQFTSIRDNSPENQPLIDRANHLLEQVSGDVRRISHNMMPGLLTKLGLFEALGDLFDNISETEGITVLAEIPDQAERLPENREIMIYRIIQEMVNNTLKHAKAEHINLKISFVEGEMEINYSDDGIGFNLEEKMQAKSFGLQSIRSRVDFLNGEIVIRSEKSEGTSYRIRVPT